MMLCSSAGSKFPTCRFLLVAFSSQLLITVNQVSKKYFLLYDPSSPPAAFSFNLNINFKLSISLKTFRGR